MWPFDTKMRTQSNSLFQKISDRTPIQECLDLKLNYRRPPVEKSGRGQGIRLIRNGVRLRSCLLGLVAFLGCTQPAFTASITLDGLITQSTQNGTGPAVNNGLLNSIQTGDPYTVTLTFGGSIQSPGTHALTSAAVVFDVPAASATESSFGPFLCGGQSVSACVTVSLNGAHYEISLLACLTTGGGCLVGNQLSANFSILATELNSQNVGALAIPGLTPLNLLEDDGVTDIQGSVARYSYVEASSIPEPSSLVLVMCGVLAVMAKKSKWTSANSSVGHEQEKADGRN